jgi:hypothetical protein
MANLEALTLSGAKLENGVPTVTPVDPITNSAEDVATFGKVEIQCALGVSAVPAAADEKGQAQGIAAMGVGGANATCISGIDRRNADIYGNLKPGDTALHPTGPNASGLVLCKADKRQIVLAQKGSDDKQILVALDGKNDKLTLTAFGYVVEISREDGINLTSNSGKAGIQLKDDIGCLYGSWQYGREPNPTLAIMLGPLTGSPGGPASAPLVPLKGFGV